MAESYVQRWARENAERAEQAEQEKVVSADASERKGQAEKKTKGRRKQTSVVKESNHR